MNIFQKILTWFGWEYVWLIRGYDWQRTAHHAYVVGDQVFARVYSLVPGSTCLLKPGGDTEGVIYVKSWEPITKKSRELYHSSTTNKIRAVK